MHMSLKKIVAFGHLRNSYSKQRTMSNQDPSTAQRNKILVGKQNWHPKGIISLRSYKASVTHNNKARKSLMLYWVAWISLNGFTLTLRSFIRRRWLVSARGRVLLWWGRCCLLGVSVLGIGGLYSWWVGCSVYVSTWKVPSWIMNGL